MKKEILWISLCAPHDDVAHGGGKTHNYYLKKVHASNQFHIHLITFCDLDEYDKAVSDLNSYGISHTVIPWTHEINAENLKRKIQLIDAMYNPLNRYGGATNEYYWDKIYQTINAGNYNPNIVVLQWTEIVLFSSRIKKVFPDAKIVAIEEDVKFLAYKRRIHQSHNRLKGMVNQWKYNNLHRSEINALSKTDLIFTYSQKDKQLLINDGIDHAVVISPYFEKYNNCNRSSEPSLDILFYGAMSRQDNYDSAIWFIKNVFYKIKNTNIRFIIAGSKPAEVLQLYASDRIIITGYVKSIKPYFENALCMVAPLVSGAGIKIKILEAMSAGIPVITNEIGIEGINAIDRKEYILCKSEADYISVIQDILAKRIDLHMYTRNSRSLIDREYDQVSDSHNLISKLMNLAT